MTQRLVLIIPIFTVVLVVTLQLNVDAGAIIAVELGDGVAPLCESRDVKIALGKKGDFPARPQLDHSN